MLTVQFAGGDGESLRAVLEGEIDFATASSMQAKVTAAREREQSSRLIMDLSRVTFMDSSGLRSILQLQRECSDADGGLVLCGPTAEVRKILTLTGLDQHLQIAETLEQAESLVAAGAADGER